MQAIPEDIEHDLRDLRSMCDRIVSVHVDGLADLIANIQEHTLNRYADNGQCVFAEMLFEDLYELPFGISHRTTNGTKVGVAAFLMVFDHQRVDSFIKQ
ncbi:hypothetical protein D3C76_1208540 [compost metagenome]